MLSMAVKVDTDDLPARVNASVRRFGSAEFTRTLEQWGLEANRHDSLRGLDRYGRPLRRWQVRRGRSDYHGRYYRRFADVTTLIPFGRASRRIDAFAISVRRRSVAGIGFGAVTLDAGFSARAGLIPSYWRRQGRDVLGLSPRTREGYRRLCERHARSAHGLLKRGRAAAAAFF